MQEWKRKKLYNIVNDFDMNEASKKIMGEFL